MTTIRVKKSAYFLVTCLLLICQQTFAQKSIPFEITPAGHILIKATVNGVTGNFLFDTGGGLTLLTKTFSNKLSGLHKQDGGYTAFRATGEKMNVDLYDATSLTIGAYEEKAPVLTIIDVNLGPIDGLISLMSFQNQPVTIDYEHHQLVFETSESMVNIKKKSKTIQLQLEVSRGKALDIFAYFIVNKKLKLQFLLDSGAGKDVFRINAAYLPQLGIDTTTGAVSYKESEFNPAVKTKMLRTGVPSITAHDVPGVAVTDVKAAFIEGLIYDGTMSLNWIGKKLTIDLKNAVMLVE
jgi:predicted aspartyl protease